MPRVTAPPIRGIDQLEGLTGRKFFLLFVFLLASLIFYPYAQTNLALYLTFRIFGNGAILFSVYAVSFRRSLVAFAVVLAIPALIHHNRLLTAHPGAFEIFNIIVSFAFDLFIVVVIFRRIFTKTRTNAETIFGALCIYLLVGFGFASIYEMLSLIQPHSFYLDPAMNLHQIPDRFDFIYYSFTTMTSLGTDNMAAVSSQTRSVTVIEALLGVLYVAVLIARTHGCISAARCRLEAQPVRI